MISFRILKTLHGHIIKVRTFSLQIFLWSFFNTPFKEIILFFFLFLFPVTFCKLLRFQFFHLKAILFLLNLLTDSFTGNTWWN